MAVAFAYAQRMLDEGRVPDWLVRIGIRMKLVKDSAWSGWNQSHVRHILPQTGI